MCILCLVSRLEIWSFFCDIGANLPHTHRQVSGFGRLVKGRADREGFLLCLWIAATLTIRKTFSLAKPDWKWQTLSTLN